MSTKDQLATPIAGVTADGVPKILAVDDNGYLLVSGTSLMSLTPAEETAIQAKLLADATPFNGATIAAILALVTKRAAGLTQTFSKHITSAANAGDVVVATITAQACTIKSVVLRSNGSSTNLTSAAISGGTGKAAALIAAGVAIVASLNAADKQVNGNGPWSLAATKTIVISLVGTGADATDFTIDIEYFANVDGGYLA